jgi:hypothetical protein
MLRINSDYIPDTYRGVNKSLARTISRCILFDGENISFDVSLVTYINSIVFYPYIVFSPSSDAQNKQWLYPWYIQGCS